METEVMEGERSRIWDRLHSLEKLIEWKPDDRLPGRRSRPDRGLHSLEKLIEWKHHQWLSTNT